MKRYRRYAEIPEDERLLIMEKCAAGATYVQVGKDHELDRRTIARIVKEGEEQKSGSDSIRLNALVRLFHEHQEAMRKVAGMILELTAGPALGRLQPPETAVWPALSSRLEREENTKQYFGRLPKMAAADQADLELREAVARRLALRKFQTAVEGLQKHLPTLTSTIQQWEQAAVAYRESWQQLAPVFPKGVSPEVREAVIQQALSRLPDYDSEDSVPVYRERPANGKTDETVSILLERPHNRRLVKAFSQRLAELISAYEALEKQLSSPQLDTALVKEHCEYCPI